MTFFMKFIKIASADDDMIEAELLSWSGLNEAWLDHDLGLYYDFLRDVVEGSYHVEVEKESWDAGFPGRSGVWHVVYSDNPRELKKTLSHRKCPPSQTPATLAPPGHDVAIMKILYYRA